MKTNKKSFTNLIFTIGIILVIFVVGFVSHVQNNNEITWQNFNTCHYYWSMGGSRDGNHHWPRDCSEVLDDLILPGWFD